MHLCCFVIFLQIVFILVWHAVKFLVIDWSFRELLLSCVRVIQSCLWCTDNLASLLRVKPSWGCQPVVCEWGSCSVVVCGGTVDPHSSVSSGGCSVCSFPGILVPASSQFFSDRCKLVFSWRLEGVLCRSWSSAFFSVPAPQHSLPHILAPWPRWPPRCLHIYGAAGSLFPFPAL